MSLLDWLKVIEDFLKGDHMPMVLIDSKEWNQLVNRINSLGTKVDTLLAFSTKGVDKAKVEDFMASTGKTLDDIIADIKDLGTKEDGLVTLMNGLEQQLKDALAGVSLPPDVQAKIDAAFDAVESRKQAIQDAIDANTPPSPPVEPAPPVDPNAPQVNPL
jgi:hypothetical protein